MTNEIRIEHYLLQLDRQLKPLPVSQRAEIVTEIKSHILGASERDPAKPLDQILNDLGTPRAVAERYLAAKGLQPAGPSRGRSVVKWLAIGTVAFFGLIFVSGIALVWYLSPIVKIDGNKGRVTLLGGLIDVNEDLGQVKIGDMVVNDAMKDNVQVQGERDISADNVLMVRIPFNTAKLNIHYSSGKTIFWDCQAPHQAELAPEISAGVLTLNLDRLSFANCELTLPSVSAIEIKGINGSMDIDRPADNMDIEMNNGNVKIKPDPALVYDFEVKVKNGLQDFFPRSTHKDAVKVKVSVVNGLVKKE